MPRPKKMRVVSEYPDITGYVPENTEPRGAIELSIEGMEAIRLTDFLGLDQETAAERMGVSRQTYGRVLAEARRVVAQALIAGKRLCIDGGVYRLSGERYRGQRRRRRGRF